MSEVQRMVLASPGMDLLVRAKTGTGKTLAFLIAALEECLQLKAFGSHSTPILIVSPTRELAAQIADEAKKLVKYHRMRVHLCVGIII
jgi:ATP-dependent RNA helicase MSS116